MEMPDWWIEIPEWWNGLDQDYFEWVAQDDENEFERKYEEESKLLFINSKWNNEGAVYMEKCTLCNYDNSETDEHLVDYLDRNGIIEIELCDSHEHELKVFFFCEED